MTKEQQMVLYCLALRMVTKEYLSMQPDLEFCRLMEDWIKSVDVEKLAVA